MRDVLRKDACWCAHSDVSLFVSIRLSDFASFDAGVCQWACAYAYVEKNDKKKKRRRKETYKTLKNIKWKRWKKEKKRKEIWNSKENEKNAKKERRGINLIITREWKRYAHRKEEQ